MYLVQFMRNIILILDHYVDLVISQRYYLPIVPINLRHFHE
ncbi:unnamed protein product [Schistosoma curassoni]|uniref:Uncharacterized protein n=1 Tax=Schistosoma curassoni TaxID=6186 RepID=A0A183JKE2_9TREM|nr:unnamed protein product [Schistosoma curassoni]